MAINLRTHFRIIWSVLKVAIVLTFFLLYVNSEHGSCSKDKDCIQTDEKSGLTDSFEHSISSLPKDQLKQFLLPVNEKPLILWWNNHLYPYRHQNEVECKLGRCDVTADRDKKADELLRAVVFSGTHFDADDLPLPREIFHEWALFHGESPKNNWMLSTNIAMSLFNHTATFRRESDYPLSSQFAKLPEDMFSSKFFVNTEEKNRLQRQLGLAAVVYVQRDCDPPSDRDTYVKELMKYIPIDSYGPCLNNKQLPEEVNGFHKLSTDEYYHFLARYKFQLAFENAICQDYMTEKVFRPIHIGSVPVYFGSPNISDFMPSNHSVIQVKDFGSPKELATLLTTLNSDDKVYNEYLKHRVAGKITNGKLLKAIDNRRWTKVTKFNKINYGSFVVSDYSCHICDKLYERYARIQQYLDGGSLPLIPHRMGKYEHMGCPQPQPVFTEKKASDAFTDHFYRIDEAKAIVRMIHAKEKNSKKWRHYVKEGERHPRKYSAFYL